MLRFAELARCEGYYFDSTTGDILRIVLPVPGSCESSGPHDGGTLDAFGDTPRFEFLTDDVTAPFACVQELVPKQLGYKLSGRIVNRQMAIQSDGSVVTEEAKIR